VEPGTTHAEPTDTRSQPAHGGSAWAGPPPGPPGPPTARTTPPGHMRHRVSWHRDTPVSRQPRLQADTAGARVEGSG